jgi:hypothetical protein
VFVQAAGMANGWRWAFLVNVFIGAVELPTEGRLLPRRQQREFHRLDPVGNSLLAATLLLR